MADKADSVSPALRPSSWPVRSQRRHAATIEFNNHVLSSLGDISLRLSRIEDTRSEVRMLPPPGLTVPTTSEATLRSKLEKRVSGMESLLFRASFSDFQVLDQVVADAKVYWETSCVQAKIGEPECEATPNHTAMRGSEEWFDIRDEFSHMGTQTIPCTMVDEAIQTESVTAHTETSIWEPVPDSTTFIVQDDRADYECEVRSCNSNTLFFGISDVCHVASQTDCQLEQGRSVSDAAEAAEFQQLVGEWTPIDELHVNDIVKVRLPFTDATVGVQVQLAQGAIGKVLRIDSEGDAEVRFPHFVALYPQERKRWILKANFDNLEKHSACTLANTIQKHREHD